ncbi:MAG: hypothetical protein IT196_26010 [Acidimicrobiales bacterium]|nr:hypothetical protein [Acidimicrobiales bacterium]
MQRADASLPTGFPSLYWREQLLPGPAASTGYRTVLFVGTTGAGKTTLIRQLIGTDPATEPFPATSTFKTTTAETEILCAPGDHYAVAVFTERAKVRAGIEECVAGAVVALAEGRPAEIARDALAAHSDERLRLEYVLGTDWLDDALATVADALGRARAADATAAGAAAAGNAEELGELVRTDPALHALVERLLADVAVRFSTLRYGQLLVEHDPSWPRCWRFTTEERSLLWAAVRRLAGNERGSHGTLLSPLVEALRVRGPLHPTWASEIPYLMVVDTEGLGHVPVTAASLPVPVLEQLQRADRIVIVDDATHPMQAAPLAALRQLVMAGQLDKLAVCFTHADEVAGPNIAGPADRRAVLRRATNQAIASLRDDLGANAFSGLVRQLDHQLFVVGHLDRRLDHRVEAEADAVGELRRLLGWLRSEAVAIDTASFRPVYRLGDLRSRLAAVCEQFATSWPQQLRRTHWRQVQALCRRIAAGEDGYGELQPVAQLTGLLLDAVREFVEHPTRWAGVPPADEQQLSLFDHFSRLVAADVLAEARAALVQRSAEQWNRAAGLRGPSASTHRIDTLSAEVFSALPRTSHEEPGLLGAVIELVRSTAEQAGFDIGDVVIPAGDVFGRNNSSAHTRGLLGRRGA